MELKIKTHIQYLFGAVIALFVINKSFLRPWVIEKKVTGMMEVFVFSVPNLIEAIVGSLLITGIIMRISYSIKVTLSLWVIQIISLLLTGTYVLTQEFKIHNLGGNNVYDQNDVIASCIGLIFTFVWLQVFGFTEIQE